MATVEFIQKRIEGKEKEISKLEKKLERILKAEETNWKVNPYYYSESDKRWTERDLNNARTSLEDYKKQLEVLLQKNASRNVPAILNFLAMWKEKVTTRYTEGLKEYFEEYKKVRSLLKEYAKIQFEYTEESKNLYKKYEEANSILYHKTHGYFEKKMVYVPWRKKEVEQDVKVKEGEYEWLKPYNQYDEDEAYKRLQKDVEEEANRKYDFIIERTNKIVGQITDASGLYISNNLELNGIIIGTNGKARVETIIAGGWNIQCEHFRVLVHPVKERN